MPDQSTLTGKDGKVYTFDPADKITQAELDAAIDKLAKTSQNESTKDKPVFDAFDSAAQQAVSAASPFGAFVAPHVNAQSVTSALPTVGGVAGEALGGPAGAGVGGAYGQGIRDLLDIGMGKEAPLKGVGEWSRKMAVAGGEQAAGAGFAKLAGMVTKPAQSMAGRIWTNAAGDTSARAPITAEEVLSRNAGRPVASNTSALARDTSLPTVIGKAGAMSTPAVDAHAAYQASAKTPAPSGNWGMLTPLKSLVPSGGTVAQGAYNAAGQSGPIAQLLRLALMSYLSGENK